MKLRHSKWSGAKFGLLAASQAKTQILAAARKNRTFQNKRHMVYSKQGCRTHQQFQEQQAMPAGYPNTDTLEFLKAQRADCGALCRSFFSSHIVLPEQAHTCFLFSNTPAERAMMPHATLRAKNEIERGHIEYKVHVLEVLLVIHWNDQEEKERKVLPVTLISTLQCDIIRQQNLYFFS